MVSCPSKCRQAHTVSSKRCHTGRAPWVTSMGQTDLLRTMLALKAGGIWIDTSWEEKESSIPG